MCIECFLSSVKNADEIVLCDTGSGDATNEKINKFKELNPDINLKSYKICVSPWRFDDARNACLSLVSPQMDLCISLDMDEYLMDGWKECLIETWEPGYTRGYHNFKTYWADGSVSEHLHDRIHIRNGYTWKLPVHEILEFDGHEKGKYLKGFWVYHKPEKKEYRSNYLPLLEQSVSERKEIWRSWSFLASEYLGAERYEEALSAISEALNIENSDKAYLYKMNYLIYKAMNHYILALLNLDNYIQHLSYRREPYFEKAMYLHQLGRNIEALLALREAEKITCKIIDYHYNVLAWDDSFKKWMSKIYKLSKKERLWK